MFKNSLKKIDIIKNLSNKKGLSLNLSKKFLNDLLLVIINNIRTGGFKLKNIGSFKIIKKRERIGRNPKTGEEFIISSRNSIRFSISKKISKKINEIQ